MRRGGKVGIITYVLIGLVMAAVMAGLVYYSSVNSSTVTAGRVARGSAESKKGGLQSGGRNVAGGKQQKEEQEKQQQKQTRRKVRGKVKGAAAWC